MKKTILTLVLALTGFVVHADDLRIAVSSGAPMVPVVLAANEFAPIRFVPVPAGWEKKMMLEGKADCAVLPVRSAVSLFNSTAEETFSIVTGLARDESQNRKSLFSVLSCSETAVSTHKETFGILTGMLAEVMLDMHNHRYNADQAHAVAEIVLKRTGLPSDPDDVAALAARIVAINSRGFGVDTVTFYTTPHDVMYSVGSLHIESINYASALLSDSLIQRLAARGLVAQ